MTDSLNYLPILQRELGIEDSEKPSVSNDFLELIILEIIRNAMFSLFMLEKIDQDRVRPCSTTSLHHFVRKKANAILSGSGYDQEEIDVKINVLLKTKNKPSEKRYETDLFDMGEILFLGGYKPIFPTQTRAIVDEKLERPVLICSWPTKILRENSIDVQLQGLTRNISNSDVTKLNMPTQSVTSFIAPPRLILESIEIEDPLSRIAYILSKLGNEQDYDEWFQEIEDQNLQISRVLYESLNIKVQSLHATKWASRPTKTMPTGLEGETKDRFWDIFKTESQYGEIEFYLFVTGTGHTWSGGKIRSIPGGLVRYLLRLFSKPKIMEIKSMNDDFDSIILNGVPPTAGRRMLSIFGCSDITTQESKKKGRLIFKSPKEYTNIISDYLGEYFFYKLEEDES